MRTHLPIAIITSQSLIPNNTIRINGIHFYVMSQSLDMNKLLCTFSNNIRFDPILHVKLTHDYGILFTGYSFRPFGIESLAAVSSKCDISQLFFIQC